MTLYVPGNGGFVHYGAEGLDRQLREGDGIHWTGDPNLSLAIGTVEEERGGFKTGRRAHRYEVWRHCEDGTDQRLGTWRMEEFGMILHEVAVMRAGAEGKAPGVIQRLDDANKATETVQTDQFRGNYGQVIEHGAWVHNQENEPKVKFGQVGKGLAE